MIETSKNAKRHRMLLGLAIMEATLPPGRRVPSATIAAFCGCSTTSIQLLEKRAMTKLRRRAQSWRFQLQSS